MKRISRRNFLKAMGISATALTLAACGGSSSSTAASTAGSSAASAVATGEPKAGGTLRLCYGNPIATPGYTPRATGNALLFYLNLAYENLLTYDNDGNMVPKLATEWDVNNDENSITWTLRENVKFADGEPFNAEAVKRNIEEYQANNRTETANIAECQIIDDTHIKMMMAEPNSSTLESVGFFVYYMSPKALENPSSLDAATCGTGPFQLSEFENNAYAIYTKNENYWKEGLPYLDSVEITVVTESSTAETAFRANEYDMLQVLDMSPLVKQDLDNDGIYVAERNENGMGVGTLGLIPNSAIDGPWADARVRRAMCYAIDVDALNAAFLMGTAQMTDQWAVPGAVTYNDDINHYKFDPDRAKELLAEAGYADGFNTNIVTVSTISDMFGHCQHAGRGGHPLQHPAGRWCYPEPAVHGWHLGRPDAPLDDRFSRSGPVHGPSSGLQRRFLRQGHPASRQGNAAAGGNPPLHGSRREAQAGKGNAGSNLRC